MTENSDRDASLLRKLFLVLTRLLRFSCAACRRPTLEPTTSHNGCNLGKAFVRERGRGTGMYRVIASNGLKCRVGIDPESAVVETFSPGAVLQVTQVCPLARWL